ncbi:MAG: anti-sigma factor [Pseudomonadota bacterium]
MAPPHFSEETLMAYVDGVADAETQRAIEAAMADDADIEARVAMFRRTRARAQEALAPLLNEPVPQALKDRVLAAAAASANERTPLKDDSPTVVPFRQRFKRPQMARGWEMAIAASVLIAVGIGGGYGIATLERDMAVGVQTADLGQAGLVAALNTLPSGAETMLGDGDRFRAIATFQVEGGALCREFEVDYKSTATLVAVACRDEGTWSANFTVAAQSADSGFAPASSLEALQAYLETIGAEAPMEPAAELEALQATK